MPHFSHEQLRRRITDWFPLVPRPRPACRALPDRVAEIVHLAHAHGSDQQRRVSAAEAHNKAALLLSDCGLSERAQQLCWRQFDQFYAHAPLETTTAKAALQPLVNLGRLYIRAGHGSRAHQLFSDADRALRTRAAIRIDDRPLDLTALLVDPEGRGELVRFLWTVLLADGTRALTRAGRWRDALVELEHRKGIGDRLLDGRQVAIIAAIQGGHYERALELLDHSVTPEAWEHAVASYLRTLCLTLAGCNAERSAATMVERYLDLTTQPTPPIFHCRLGLCVLDLTDHASVATAITRKAITSSDAHAADDVLAHPTCAHETDRPALAEIIATAGLHHGTQTSTDLLDALMKAVAASEDHLAEVLTR